MKQLKQFRLILHQKSFSVEDVLINSKDFEKLRIGDVIEVYSPEVDYSRLLLQVKTFADAEGSKTRAVSNGTISVDEDVAARFQLRSYSMVNVDIPPLENITLDSLELKFIDQYLSRSVMWRMKKSLANSCVYQKKNIEFCGIRTSALEMWHSGDRMASGYVSPDTKIVFRSASSMVYLFLQMSSEMWDFDIHGDLYFEKAVNGFLSDLFEKWRKCNCTHDVTIVMFSRTFFEAQSIDEFPEEMRGCLQQDYKGRFYEDYYRIAIQNERYDDWSSVLIKLKILFNKYEDEILQFHEKYFAMKNPSIKIPRAFNSTSSQGNFLEVLNMSLNVFEKHYLDRSFDRTGQLSVVISPGVGVFEVDFDLTNITKQRIIDNGIGSDLVCLGEQPLHAVPLFKFNRKESSSYPANAADVYNMPHWINLSFYSSHKSMSHATFVPRIKMPTILQNQSKKDKPCSGSRQSSLIYSPSRECQASKPPRQMISLVDYDEYDAQIFKPVTQTATVTNTSVQPLRRKSERHTNVSDVHDKMKRRASDYRPNDADSSAGSVGSHGGNNGLATISPTSSEGIPIASSSRLEASPHTALSSSVENRSTKEVKPKIESKDDLTIGSSTASANKAWVVRPKALINPFDPSHVTIKLTSNRRRWTHVFPLGPTGIFMQQHHYQAVPQNTACTMLPSEAIQGTEQDPNRKVTIPCGQIRTSDLRSTSMVEESGRPRTVTQRMSLRSRDPENDNMSYAWGATGEQEWTPAITTGVDWKSLVVPACLPITTDFFPNKVSLNNDYVMSAYTLLPEEQGQELLLRVCYRGGEDLRNHMPFLTHDVLQELICQRLQQGFQIVLMSRPTTQATDRTKQKKDDTDFTLSIGRIFHKLTLENNAIIVTQYRPRHPYPVVKLHYCYRFRAPDNETFGVSWSDFSSERLENYNWNYLDNYICLRGEDQYELRDSLKFWRFRLLVLPNICQSITKRITETKPTGEEALRCLGAYRENTHEDRMQIFEGFLKFIAILSKVRQPYPAANTKKPKAMATQRRFSSQGPSVKHDSPRERCGSVSAQSNVSQERQRMFSGPVAPRGKDRVGELRDEVDGAVLSCATTPNQVPVKKDKVSADFKSVTFLNDVIEKMKTCRTLFMMQQKGLPPMSFISAEAIFWAIESVDSVANEAEAVELFSRLLEAGFICHCSRERRHPSSRRVKFLSGFYLYFIVDRKQGIPDAEEVDLEMFEKDWLEIEMYFKEVEEDARLLPFHAPYEQKFGFRKATLDVDCPGRCEWVHLRYHSIFDPGQAYEIDLDWMVVTSHQIADIVNMWNRKAVSNSLHMVPIPHDPFALPFEGKADPLRGPIYISLKLECLPKILSADELVRFRDKILIKWGFLPFYEPNNEGRRQYVHVSGSMFVMIPNSKWNPKNESMASMETKSSVRGNSVSSPHDEYDEYITRHFSGVRQTGDGKENKKINTGFLWSWNYMITKRWKTQATGDEAFMRKIMADFNLFCENVNDRLVVFWTEHPDEQQSVVD